MVVERFWRLPCPPSPWNIKLKAFQKTDQRASQEVESEIACPLDGFGKRWLISMPEQTRLQHSYRPPPLHLKLVRISVHCLSFPQPCTPFQKTVSFPAFDKARCTHSPFKWTVQFHPFSQNILTIAGSDPFFVWRFWKLSRTTVSISTKQKRRITHLSNFVTPPSWLFVETRFKICRETFCTDVFLEASTVLYFIGRRHRRYNALLHFEQ